MKHLAVAADVETTVAGAGLVTVTSLGKPNPAGAAGPQELGRKRGRTLPSPPTSERIAR